MSKAFLRQKSLSKYYNRDSIAEYMNSSLYKYFLFLCYAVKIVIGVVLIGIFFFEPALAIKPARTQKEDTATTHRYRERERSSRYYETYEAKPRPYPVFVRGGIPQREAIILSPIAEKVRRRKYLADSHWGLKFYERLTCIRCHPHQARNLHKRRAKITCRQCHGEEPIAGLKHYYSKMNPRRRHAFICAKCHKGATKAFAAYIVHEPNPAFKTTQKSFPLLFFAFWAMMAIAVGTFAAFLLHSIFWGWREFHSAEKPDTAYESRRIRRFTRTQRVFHAVLIVTFVTQTATGLARLFGGTMWGRSLASLFGGYNATLQVHKWVGLFMLTAFGIHVIYILGCIEWRRFPGSIYGPDSLLPRFADVRQAIQHLGWMAGKHPHPRFDRWTYWEKFDYWAVFWGICILGSTGLILYSPVFSSLYMPGWAFNAVLWVHRIEAILAMAHVFTIHFFIGHLRRHNFPMDLTIFEGSTDSVNVHLERPAWMERMREQDKLQEALVAGAPYTLRLILYAFGFAIMGVCLYLFLNSLVHGVDLIKYFFK